MRPEKWPHFVFPSPCVAFHSSYKLLFSTAIIVFSQGEGLAKTERFSIVIYNAGMVPHNNIVGDKLHSRHAEVAKLATAIGLVPIVARFVGSNPTLGINKKSPAGDFKINNLKS